MSLAVPASVLGRSRVLVAPVPRDDPDAEPTLAAMERLGAYEPVLRKGGQLVDEIRVPGVVVDRWLLCLCLVRGRVVKDDSGRPVCGARVHICEVDKIWRWLLRLPERDLLRLRDDLLRVIEIPPLRRPPRPEPGPLPPELLARAAASAESLPSDHSRSRPTSGGYRRRQSHCRSPFRQTSSASRLCHSPFHLPRRPTRRRSVCRWRSRHGWPLSRSTWSARRSSHIPTF